MKALNKNNLAGMTAAGWLIIVIAVVFVIYIAIKLVPLYLEYGSVKSSMASVYEQDVTSETNYNIKRLLQKRFDVNNVSSVEGKNSVIKVTPEGRSLIVKYDKKVPLFGNVSAFLEFENEQPLQ